MSAGHRARRRRQGVPGLAAGRRAAGHRPGDRVGRARGARRTVGLGQVDAAPHHRHARPADDGHRPDRRPRRRGAQRPPAVGAPRRTRSASSSSSSSCSAASRRSTTSPTACCTAASGPRSGARPPPRRSSGSGLGHRLRPPPGPAVGWRAAAGRDRPGPRRPAGDRPRRRADRQPRHRDRRTSCSHLLAELHAADGTTIVVITHDRDVAAMLPRRIEIRDGRIERDMAGRRAGPARDAAVGVRRAPIAGAGDRAAAVAS